MSRLIEREREKERESESGGGWECVLGMFKIRKGIDLITKDFVKIQSISDAQSNWDLLR